ncbi:MAG: 2-oxoacid:acceptor oxidoreductase family protein [Desulfobacterales bacterium]|nr:MAG: 2-oxoacid:acceptor oxidoreductase family protein [Desulfobacterales bacterium]
MARIMKAKFRLAGRGGQGIKFVGSVLASAAMRANYHTTVSVDYTPSVRGGPIFCDVVISSAPIFYPFCDRDADVLLMLDQEGAARAGESVCQKTACFVDAHTVKDPEKFMMMPGLLLRCPFSKRADENKIPGSVNILALGWLSQYIRQKAAAGELPALEDEHYHQVIESMPPRFRDVNTRAFELGKKLFDEAPVTSA